MNLKLLGRMVINIINIIEHNPCENKSVKMTKNNQPLKGEKGPLKGGKGPWKGRLVRRLLRTNDKPNGFKSEHTIKKNSKQYDTTTNWIKG